jgi:hypothetical protein
MPCEMLSKFMATLRLENSLLQAGADIAISVVTDNPKMARNPASQRHYESPSRPMQRSRWEAQSKTAPPRAPIRRIASPPQHLTNKSICDSRRNNFDAILLMPLSASSVIPQKSTAVTSMGATRSLLPLQIYLGAN